MAKEDLIKRDGSAALGGPRRPVPERPAKEPGEAETGLKEFGGYGDSKVVGHFDETAVLKAAHGNPSPRGAGRLLERPRGGPLEAKRARLPGRRRATRRPGRRVRP